MDHEKVLLAHGSGGRLTYQLIQEVFLKSLGNYQLERLDDGARIDIQGTRLAYSTDSYVVKPIFFPGGDIGSLAVFGTVNDLAMCGAQPLYLSVSLIIGEGFLLEDLKRIVSSMKRASDEAGVQIITGDTKVVERTSCDGIFVNTTGVGLVMPGVDVSGSNLQVGDKVILSGPIGEHGITIISVREGLEFATRLKSDCCPLNHLVARLVKDPSPLHALRDPTRGGLATSLNELAIQSNVGIEVEEGSIKIPPEVQGASELLGIDPLYVANEGKMIVVVAADRAQEILSLIREDSYGKDAAIIGEVVRDHPKKVVLHTVIGGRRILDMLTGEQLPRIC